MATSADKRSGSDSPRPDPRDKWWFSPMLQVVAGVAIIAFQWGPISTGTANWLNWLVAAAGLAVAVFGARGWLAARPRA